jgi:hypothetical protein
MTQTSGDIRARFAAALAGLEMNEMAPIPVTIGRDVIGTVLPNDVDTIDHLKSLVSGSASKETIISFLLGIGYPANHAETLFTIVSRNNDLSTFVNYINNRTITLSSLIGGISDANRINETIGIPSKISPSFYGFKWVTSPPMGPGEVWLSTILAGGKRPSSSEKGDVMVEGVELEVKGPGGRIVGQSGYGDAKQIRAGFFKAMQRIATNLGIADFTPIDNGKDNYWNIGEKAPGVEENLKAISKLNRGFSSKDIAMVSNELVTVYQLYLLNLNISQYSTVLTQALGKDGSVNCKAWHAEILPMFFEYYQSLEQFNYIAFTGDNGKFLIIESFSFRDAFNKGLIKIIAKPSFTNGAGTQGGTYSISVGK